MRVIEECLICGAIVSRTLFRAAHPWLVNCSGCGFSFSAQRPSDTELAEYYATYPIEDRISAITVNRFDELLEDFRPFRKTNRLLDYGAGDGFFAARAQSADWNCFVMEISPAKVTTCQAKGLGVLSGSSASRHQGWFDVVVAQEVIEHVSDPSVLVDFASTVLRKGGLLYLTTPNIDGLSRRALGPRWRVIEYPEHLNYFSPSTLRRLISRRGFRIRRIRTTGLDVGAWNAVIRRQALAHEQASISREAVRATWERPSKARLKAAINAVLSVCRLGDTIKLWAVRSGSAT